LERGRSPGDIVVDKERWSWFDGVEEIAGRPTLTRPLQTRTTGWRCMSNSQFVLTTRLACLTKDHLGWAHTVAWVVADLLASAEHVRSGQA